MNNIRSLTEIQEIKEKKIWRIRNRDLEKKKEKNIEREREIEGGKEGILFF